LVLQSLPRLAGMCQPCDSMRDSVFVAYRTSPAWSTRWCRRSCGCSGNPQRPGARSGPPQGKANTGRYPSTAVSQECHQRPTTFGEDSLSVPSSSAQHLRPGPRKPNRTGVSYRFSLINRLALPHFRGGPSRSSSKATARKRLSRRCNVWRVFSSLKAAAVHFQ